jgi:2-(1,2-epoxy-1,2-dihydrophenyl)acetyl-CoA isomerase
MIRGAGSSFCAGGDIKELRARQEQIASAGAVGTVLDGQIRALVAQANSVHLLQTMPKPTIAVIRGWAIGAGLSIALAADLRVAGVSAKLQAGFAKRSFSGDFGISYLLAHGVGSMKAREIMLLDPVINASEALALGLVTEVHPDGELDNASRILAERVADGPTIAFGRMKDNVTAAETWSLPEVIRLEALNQRLSGNTADASAALRAFIDGKDPEFTGR